MDIDEFLRREGRCGIAPAGGNAKAAFGAAFIF
jgi:hypothetical protein